MFDLTKHRILIDACLKNNVWFFWHGAGTMLIDRAKLPLVLREVQNAGYEVLGLEGFEMESLDIHPRLDLIYDAERRPEDGLTILETWPDGVWVDVVLRRREQSR